MTEGKKLLNPGTLCFAALLQAGAAVALIPGNTARMSLLNEYASMEKIFPESFFERTIGYADAILDGGRLPDKILNPIRNFLIPERSPKTDSDDAERSSERSSEPRENTRAAENKNSEAAKKGSERKDAARDRDRRKGASKESYSKPSAISEPGDEKIKRTRRQNADSKDAIDAPWWFSYVGQRIEAVKALIALLALRLAAASALWPICAVFLGAALADCICMRKSRAARAVPAYTGRYRIMIVMSKLSAFAAAACLFWPWAENPLLLETCVISSCLFCIAAFAQLRSKSKI